MLLRLPQNLHYPIKIAKIEKRVGDAVTHSDAVFLYSYTIKVKEEERNEVRKEEDIPWVEKTLHQHFNSTLEGTIKAWRVWEGDIIRHAVDICEIEEECPHTVQFLGMCTNCGKDMTSIAAGSGTTDADRAPIRMTHDTAHLAISKEEANRVDDEAKRRLLSSRKLSLVVDLDQTVIHAAVDPTIKEWMDDKDNPNHDAVSDVRAFQLTDDGPGMRGCWYYIKLRPGLAEFLEHISQLYELHIYTMGTRQYADQIAKLVDPNGRYFNDRILSRDESGSMVAKNLERLFPVDTKMVVIIDDRGDVWKWSANLIRVTPFDFFVGIGDINSSFLPKKQEIQATPKAEPVKVAANGTEKGANEEGGSNGGVEDETSAIQNGTAALEQLIAMSGGDSPEVRELQTKDQEEIINSQLEEKPLLRMQLQQDQKDEAEAATNGDAAASQSTESDSTDSSDSSESNSSPKHKARHSILKNDDEELVHLEVALTRVHETFFAEYDRKRLGGKGGRVAELTGKRKAPLPSQDDNDGHSLDLMLIPDVKRVMPAMKIKVLSGVRIVFSGVLPLGTDIQNADISTWAKTFGATITDKVSRDVTHVIAARPGTAKVKQAVKRGIKVVGTPWLIESMQRWRKLDERPYLLEGVQKQKQDTSSELGDNMDKSSANPNDFLLSSSDGDTDAPDTEDDRPARKRPKLDTAIEANQDTYDEVVDDGSPVTLDQDEWAEIDAELKEFMGSDLDSESDTDSVNSALSIREGRTKKRRREEDDEEDSSSSDKERSPRKRNGTGSALKTVKNIDSERTSEAADTPATGETDERIRREQRAVEVAQEREEAEEEDSDDELTRELERELEEYDNEQ
ncbi:CTD phosphatase Fcp1 [Cladophialophora chaetospira]|uniref:RNA polymerase II subunit A C-terminal domain phosphatase n=1 Tax=Cladophialophora chaetospira TaxID=386627 RepID=A0AA39CJV0_9EURO|nr:CTD phosphatase Fcp1 [Cladophialophora chaetospira]